MVDKSQPTEPLCRNKRKALGLAYPKSNCQKCGPIIRVGWRCADEVGADTEALKTSVTGQIEVTTNAKRQKAFVRINKIAAVVSICQGGPTNLIFDNGGEMEICGDAEWWRHQIAITEVSGKTP